MRPGRRKALRRLGFFALGLGVAYIFGCYELALAYLSPRRADDPLPRGLVEVKIPDVDNRLDPAWCTPKLSVGKPSPVVFVFAHGHGGSLSAYSGLMLAMAEHGVDSIAPAMPGQDASPQRRVGFGTTESDVMVRAANWIRTKSPRVKIVYAGVSMGGAAAWFASEKDPIAVGVVSEAAYANFDEALRTIFSHKAPGADIYLRPVVWMASAMSGLRPEKIVPLEAAEKWRGRPALVIEGSDDTTIPVSHARRLAAASGAPLWIIPGAAHANGYQTAPKEYLARLLTLAKRVERHAQP